jgi:RNA polymerase sigma-70 factor (ECF subfamily)
VTTVPLHNESELLLLTAQGDEKAFANLFHHYADAVYGVALVYTKSTEIAEEVVQDIFLKIWVKRQDLGTVRRFDDYLFITVRNHVLNYLRQKKRDQQFINHLATHFEESALSPELQLQFKESEALIQKAVSALPPQQQAVYKLARQEGLSLAEVAEQMGLSRNTVRNHLARSLESIRTYLKANSGSVLCFTALMMTC